MARSAFLFSPLKPHCVPQRYMPLHYLIAPKDDVLSFIFFLTLFHTTHGKGVQLHCRLTELPECYDNAAILKPLFGKTLNTMSSIVTKQSLTKIK